MVQVPGLGDERVGLRVHDRIFQDVDRPSHVHGEDSLRPARQAVGLRQQSPGQQVVAGGDLAV